eukprot:scaffold260599_cov32-Tisochrysis_lutea.AAC.1
MPIPPTVPVHGRLASMYKRAHAVLEDGKSHSKWGLLIAAGVAPSDLRCRLPVNQCNVRFHVLAGRTSNFV